MLSDRNELTFRVNMLFRPMGESDKTFKQHNNDWTDHHQPAAAYSAASTSGPSLAHGQHSWLAPPSHFASSNGPVTTSLPQQAPAAAAPRFTPTTTALPSYQGWSGYDFHNNHLDPVQSHIMSAPTTPMTEDGPPVSYIQGHQHPYAVSPSYATLTSRRDQPRNDTLHHQSPEHYDYDRQQQHAFQTWDYQQHHAHHSGGESPSSEHFYPSQDDYRKSSVAASGMPMMTSSNTNTTTTPPPMADYQYSPNLGDETPSPISNSYPTSSDYLSYHEDEAPKHSRRYSIGGGMITAAPHNTNMPSYPPYMKAYHYKVPLTERPYKCDKCPQSFNRNHDLKRHKRIHLSVKPFPCQTCDKQFSRKDALKRHILVKRCGQPLPPDGRRSSNHQNVSRSTSGVSNNNRNKSGALDLTDQYANAAMAPPY